MTGLTGQLVIARITNLELWKTAECQGRLTTGCAINTAGLVAALRLRGWLLIFAPDSWT